MRNPGLHNMQDPFRTLYTSLKSLAWSYYLVSISLSILDVNGFSLPTSNRDNFASLQNYQSHLITKPRPWLSLFPSGILTILLGILWAAVVVLLRWEAGVDYSCRMRDVFVKVVSGAIWTTDVKKVTFSQIEV